MSISQADALPKVSVVVLNLNGYEDTRECLLSLRRVRYPNLEIILVDNGSTDGSFVRLRDEFPDVRQHGNEKNLGCGGGRNVGIARALEGSAEYVLLLDNDTVVDPDFLTHLVKVGEAEAWIGVLGPKISYYSDPERIWYAGGKLKYIIGVCRHAGQGELERGGSFCRVADTGFVTGCALMVKSAVFRRVGAMDPKLFGWEDTDFCSRVRKAGYRCVFVPSARVWHKVSRTCGAESPFTLYVTTRDHLAWVAAHVPFPYKAAALPLTLARKVAKMVLLAGHGRRSASAVWAGIWAFARGVHGPPPQRWKPSRDA